MERMELIDGFFNALEKLAKSQIVQDEHTEQINNLCGAIDTIADDICGDIDLIETINGNNGSIKEFHTERITTKAWQIGSISEVISEKMFEDGYAEAGNLCHYYEEMKKAGIDPKSLFTAASIVQTSKQ